MGRKARIAEVRRLETETAEDAAFDNPPYGTSNLVPAVNQNVLAAGTVVATVVLTPKLTGKFRIFFIAGIRNTEAVAHTAQVTVTVPGFTYASVIDNIAASIGASVNLSGTVQNVAALPLGAPLTFTLTALADVDNKVQVVALTAQLIVQELES